MSVGNTNFQNTYTTDGTAGPWAFNWVYTEEIQVQVYLDLVLQSPSTYTVTKDLVSPGGTISFNAGSIPILGKALLIQRFSNTLQTDTLGTNQELPPATLVRMADKLTIIAQQLSAQILRSLALPLTSIGVSAELPTPVAGAFPCWNAAANAIQYVSPVQAGLALIDNGPGLPPSYGPVTSAAGGNVIGSGISAVDNLVSFNNTGSSAIKDSGYSVASVITASEAPADPALNGFRLSLHATNPIPGDITSALTVYSIPYNGNKISLWDSALSKMRAVTSGIISETIAASTFYYRIGFLYEYLNAGVADLEINWWDTAQSTKAITLLTIANPCVITCTAHGWSVGDKIGIRRGTAAGTAWTDTAMGLDQKEFYISATTTNTVTLEGCDTSALAVTNYTGATAYKIPTTPATATTQTEGVWFKSGDRTRRLVGLIKTNGAGTIDNSSVLRRNLSNVDNQIDLPLTAEETTAAWTSPGTGLLGARSSSLQIGVNRVEFALALPQVVQCFNADASSGAGALHAQSLNRVSQDAPGAYTTCFDFMNLGYGTGYEQSNGSLRLLGLAAGAYFIQRLALQNGAAYNGSASAANGGARSFSTTLIKG